jgi:hypothetical protein
LVFIFFDIRKRKFSPPFKFPVLHCIVLFYSEDMKQSLKKIETMLAKAQTEVRGMSEPSSAFATGLLSGLSMSWHKSSAIFDEGVGEPTDNFSWEQDLLNCKGGTANISEPDGTPSALEWLFSKLSRGLVVDGKAIGVKDVKGKLLTPIKAVGMQANGKSDGCVADELSLTLCEESGESFYSYGMALVEMQTNINLLNKAQMLLQLAAFSRESTWGQSTVLLGTDGNKKWYLLYFEKFNSICLTQYKDGRKCLERFEYFLMCIKSRQAELEKARPKRARLDAVQEQEFGESLQEQDLEGFPQAGGASLPEEGGQSSQEEVNKALNNEAFLHRLANALAESAISEGIRPTVPEWSRAKNKVPSYYM